LGAPATAQAYEGGRTRDGLDLTCTPFGEGSRRIYKADVSAFLARLPEGLSNDFDGGRTPGQSL